jgi:hypothetical protein
LTASGKKSASPAAARRPAERSTARCSIKT